MPQTQRYLCSNCERPIDEVKVGTKLVPLVAYLVVGQVPDAGPPIDLLEDGVKVPSLIREIMQPHVSVARLEFCIPCFAELLGLKMYSAKDDPMYSPEQVKLTGSQLAERRQDNPHASSVEKHHDEVSRVLLGFKVGRGAVKAPKLPKPVLVKHPEPKVPSLRPAPQPGRRARRGRAVQHVEPINRGDFHD
jgi:hypothetical protein